MRTDTQHAPSERADWETLYNQLTLIKANRALQETVLTASKPILVLNTYRQIVYANEASQTLLCPNEDPAILYGCRPGEVMHCVHAEQGVGGCGTSTHCRICEAVNTVLKSLKGQMEMKQCSIHIKQKSQPMEFILSSMPLHLGEQRFALITISQCDDQDNLAENTFAIQRMVTAIEKS